jgi:hypothetical protein
VFLSFFNLKHSSLYTNKTSNSTLAKLVNISDCKYVALMKIVYRQILIECFTIIHGRELLYSFTSNIKNSIYLQKTLENCF